MRVGWRLWGLRAVVAHQGSRLGSCRETHGRHAWTAGRVGCVTFDMVSRRTLWRGMRLPLEPWPDGPIHAPCSLDRLPPGVRLASVVVARMLSRACGWGGAIGGRVRRWHTRDRVWDPAGRRTGGTRGLLDGCVACHSAWCRGVRCGGGCVCLWSRGPMDPCRMERAS